MILEKGHKLIAAFQSLRQLLLQASQTNTRSFNGIGRMSNPKSKILGAT
jgi:hypothetical protein